MLPFSYRELHLPDSGPVARPAPRRHDLLGESLPRLLPPLPPHVQAHHHSQHQPVVEKAGEVADNSLDVTSASTLDAGGQKISGVYAPSTSHCVPSNATHPPLPSSHPLGNRRVQEQMLLMRKEMRTLLDLKMCRM